MNRGLKIGGLVVLLLGAGVGAYFLFRKDEEDSPTPSPNGNKNSTSTKYKNNDFPLKKDSGDTGQSVKRVSALQRFLNWTGSYGLTVDGKFGPKTLNALKQEQSPFEDFKAMWPNAVHGEVSEAYYNQEVKPFEDPNYSGFSGYANFNRPIGQTREDECEEGDACPWHSEHWCLQNGYDGCEIVDDECNGECISDSDGAGAGRDVIRDKQKQTTSFINANGTWCEQF